VPALEFLRRTLLDGGSPACLWRHPAQAARVAAVATGNLLLGWSERLVPGGTHQCPVCDWRGRRFRAFLSADEVIPGCICPGCGSFDRHRLLVLGVREELSRQPAPAPELMLGFSLSPAMRYLLEREGLARCLRTDVALDGGRFAPDFVGDLRRAPVRDGSVDWIFCSHVLEHIDDLDACLGEMSRILRPGGVAWIQVPIELGEARSRRIPVDPHRAHAHAWRFGRDFGSLLQRREWGVREMVAEQAHDRGVLRLHGIDPRERYWLARKA
jgi:SAM-dependent methyltransferase